MNDNFSGESVETVICVLREKLAQFAQIHRRRTTANPRLLGCARRPSQHLERCAQVGGAGSTGFPLLAADARRAAMKTPASTSAYPTM